MKTDYLKKITKQCKKREQKGKRIKLDKTNFLENMKDELINYVNKKNYGIPIQYTHIVNDGRDMFINFVTPEECYLAIDLFPVYNRLLQGKLKKKKIKKLFEGIDYFFKEVLREIDNIKNTTPVLVEDVEDVEEEPSLEMIRIVRHGSEVTAINTMTEETGVARCHPLDEFSMKTGAELALKRLFHDKDQEVADYTAKYKIHERTRLRPSGKETKSYYCKINKRTIERSHVEDLIQVIKDYEENNQ